MKVEVELDETLLRRRQQEWDHWRANPAENPLSTRAGFDQAEVVLENELCVYVQDSRYADGLPYSGYIVTRAPRQSVFDLTPAEAGATHVLLTEVRAYLEATVRPDGYTVGWNVFPAGGAHIPHVHLHVIPRWNADLAAGAGLRYFLKEAARQLSIRPATAADLPAIHELILGAGLGSDPALITATLEGCSYWLAIQDGTAIGCVGLEHGPVSAGGGASLLRSACVRPGWRGRGVGKRLAATALSAARERGDRAVYLFSSHAGAYWQRLGFLPMGVAEPRARGWIHAESAWKLDLPR